MLDEDHLQRLRDRQKKGYHSNTHSTPSSPWATRHHSRREQITQYTHEVAGQFLNEADIASLSLSSE